MVSSWERGDSFGNAREVRRLFNEVVATHGAWLIEKHITSGDELKQLRSVHLPVGEALVKIGQGERADHRQGNGEAGYL